MGFCGRRLATSSDCSRSRSPLRLWGALSPDPSRDRIAGLSQVNIRCLVLSQNQYPKFVSEDLNLSLRFSRRSRARGIKRRRPFRPARSRCSLPGATCSGRHRLEPVRRPRSLCQCSSPSTWIRKCRRCSSSRRPASWRSRLPTRSDATRRICPACEFWRFMGGRIITSSSGSSIAECTSWWERRAESWIT